MAKALELAKKGCRAVAPNPMVGAVIVKNGKIIGKGYHQKFGGPHAEVQAVHSVKNGGDLVDSTLYVTLEPCRHQGKTPPCSKLIESVGISRVVCGSMDPFQKSDEHRAVSVGLLKGKINKECRELNKFFLTWVEKKRPFITVKIAISADGFVAGKDGHPVHFTSKKQDTYVHELRAQHQAILVGSQTVLMDNPHLGVRHVKGPDPLRVILDSKNQVPKSFQVFRDENVYHVQKRLPLKTLFRDLGKMGISSVLVEPGPTLYSLLKKEGLVDELIVLRGRKKIHEGMSLNL